MSQTVELLRLHTLEFYVPGLGLPRQDSARQIILSLKCVDYITECPRSSRSEENYNLKH